MRILAIESSCDETAAAIVEDGVHEICSVVSSSKEFHEVTGGVVPEVAARKQMEAIIPVIEQTMQKFSGDKNDIDALAVTVGPGLIGSLLVGVQAARALAFAWNKPLIPVNHLVGHLYANFIDSKKTVEFPAIGLVVSGGHTDLILIKDHGDFEFLGGTLDDAAGEAFDKTARLLGLSKYLGGVELSNLAATCQKNLMEGRLPRPMMHQPNYDFSFSGLKTAVKRIVENEEFDKASLACEFETAATDVIIYKTMKAAKNYHVRSILVGGGVSANKILRARLQKESEKLGITLHIPPLRLCSDNAIYIASAAYFASKEKELSKITADPSLGIMDRV